MRRLHKRHYLIVTAVHVTAFLTVASALSAAAPQTEWEKTLAAAEQEGQVTVYGAPGITYQNAMGGEFLRRLFSEMEITTSRDQRLMIDWLAQGKSHLHLFATANDIEDAKKKGLPVDLIDPPDDESYISGDFGHVALISKAPRPNAARVFVNWLLSKEGQTRWQEKTDNNSFRTDISKSMLSDSNSVPKQTGRYLNSSLPQYQDVELVLKIVEEALTKAGKK